jgi:ribosomal protein L29
MKEFKNKTKEQLEIILVDKRKVLRDFRFNLTSSQVKDVKVARNTRRSIAQVLTLLNQMATQKVTIASSAK